MDGAKAHCLRSTVEPNVKAQRVGGRAVCLEGLGVTLAGTDCREHPGTSSNYSNETFEGRRGEGFRGNGNRPRFSRS